MDYVDIAFAHCYDPITSMEEVVRGFNFLIEQGYCFYWGTSEWSARQIQEAIGVAEKFGLIGPVVEQPQYSLLVRDKVEVEYRQLYPKMGLTTWSPLAYGIVFISSVFKSFSLLGSIETEFQLTQDLLKLITKIHVKEKV